MAIPDLKLSISKIYGTSSQNCSQFVTQGDLIAYTASAGVVVCKLKTGSNLKPSSSSSISSQTTIASDELNTKATDLPSTHDKNVSDESQHIIQWQKFFCANSMLVDKETPIGPTSMPVLLDYTSERIIETDKFGFPLKGEPDIVTREATIQTNDDPLKSPIATSYTQALSDSSTPPRAAGPTLRIRKDDFSSVGSPASAALLSPGFSGGSSIGGVGSLTNRVRSINCIAISPNKRMLAVGEVGYQPRILLYSLAPDSSCRPIAIIHEHQFGCIMQVVK
ncbi:unnamed protein product [Ambrosiozyma monospora]|uniref:Unnamed protein product n=1 Tax=Ambrosiozyma monospora TaxID=43982 RepID=A0A9W7DC03_AMBMO|nr:unnamed protein product [Ambrosiozyma monospora]